MNDRIDPIRVETERLSNDHTALNRPATLSDRVRSLRLENPSVPRGSRFGWLPWVLCIVFLLAGAAGGFMGAGIAKFQPAKASTGATDGAKADSGDVVLEAKGYIIPSRTYQVSPKVSGMVQEHVIEKEGDFFEEGAVLAKLEDVDYKADRDHAQFTLANAQERLAQLQKELPEEIEKAKCEL